MIAMGVHAIAVFLFNLQEKSHQGDIQSVVSFRQPDELFEWMPGKWTKHLSISPFPSIFTHTEYTFHEQYPNGLADVAAYWAEDRVFGGVLLFDRGESGTECKDVYVHSNRHTWTVRVWRPLESQLEQILDFLKHGPAVEESPFPLYADEKVRHRYDAYDAMAWHHVYRDPWERVLPPEKDEHNIRRNTFDYPELQEELFDKISDGPFYTIGRGDAFFEVKDAERQNEAMLEESTINLAKQDVRETSSDKSSIFDDENVRDVAELGQDVNGVEAETLAVGDSPAGKIDVNESQVGDARMTGPDIDESRIAELDSREIEIGGDQITATENISSRHEKPEVPEPVISGHQSVELAVDDGEIDGEQVMGLEVLKEVTKHPDINGSQVQEPENYENKVGIVPGGDEAGSTSKKGTS